MEVYTAEVLVVSRGSRVCNAINDHRVSVVIVAIAEIDAIEGLTQIKFAGKRRSKFVIPI